MPAVKTLEFRFKVPEISVDTPLSQSLLINRTGSDNGSTQFALVLEYTGSLTSGSYSGSIVDPYYQYGTLKFILGSESSSVYLPFYNGGWWSVMVNQTLGETTYYSYNLYAKNKISSGDDGNTIGFQASSSLGSYAYWNYPGTTQIPGSGSATLNGQTYVPATASFQEVRYYSTALSESVFNDYVMNGDSIEGNTSSYDELFFRAALGSELYLGTSSIHPSVTGSSPTASFIDGTSTFGYTGSYNFISNTETAFYDQVPAGIRNSVSNKLKQSNIVLPYISSANNIPDSQVLSPYRSVQQNFAISSSYTRDVDYVEVAFSPQNEINEDIMDSLGYFNIGEYIGDPRQISSSNTSYPDLDTLRDNYFKKYTHNYNIWDYTRLIKYFDNSLFKMIKDWTPARTSLATGVVIKQHLLERNKYPTPQASVEQQEYTASIDMYEVTGSNGGGLNITPVVTQSWTGAHTTLSGSVPFTQTSEDEFYNGEFSGSFIEISNGELSDYTIDLNQVFTASQDYQGSGGTGTGDYPNGLITSYVPFDFKSDKTYYISFTALRWNRPAGITPLEFRSVDGTVLYSGSIPADNLGSWSGSVTVDKAEIKGAIPKTYFYMNTGVNLPGYSGSIRDFKVFEYVVSDPNSLPLENSVDQARLSTAQMDVDYSGGSLTPINLQQILTGSATRFAIPDSYYTSLNHITPRYLGSKYSGDYNLSSSFANLSTPTGYPIDNFVNYFVYFDWIGGSDPQYPGGGNVHCTYLIDIEGRAYPLTSKNEYVHSVSNIFKKDTTAYIIPAVYSAGNESIKVDIADGGAIYNTIIEKSGSGDLSSGFSPAALNVSLPTASPASLSGNIYFSSSLATSSILYPQGQFFEVLNATTWSEAPYAGDPIVTYVGQGGVRIFDKVNGLSTSVSAENTLLPLQQNDLIRFGVSNGTTFVEGLDNTFDNGYLYYMQDILGPSGAPNDSGSFKAIPSVYGINKTYGFQTFRIMRRVPNEMFVLVKDKPTYVDPGFLIPENFNPNYDPYELAKIAGVI